MLKYQEVKNLVDDEKNLPLLNKIAARFGISDFKDYVNRLSGFTLAEMLVLLLIGSIFMAASMPVVTQRTKTLYDPELDDIWKYTSNKKDIYFKDKVSIGSDDNEQKAALQITSDTTAKNVNANGVAKYPHLMLGNPSISTYSNYAFLLLSPAQNLVLGSGTAQVGSDVEKSVVIGHGAKAYVSNSIAIGTAAIVDDYDLQKNKARGHYLTFTWSFQFYYTTVSKHNFITGITYIPYDHDCSYTRYHHEVTRQDCGYVYGQGFLCAPPVVVRVAYTEYIQVTCTDFYSRWYFDYAEKFSAVRDIGAYFTFSVRVRCPNFVTITSPTTGVKETVYVKYDIMPLSGSYTVFKEHMASGKLTSLQTITSYALYSYDLAHAHLVPDSTVTTGHCHDFLAAQIPAAEERVKAAADAVFDSGPKSSIAIGAHAKARNKNTIVIGSGYATEPNYIVLGGSDATLWVRGSQATSSDKRLKNIKGLYNRGIKELRKLKTYLFTFKSDNDNNLRAGLIAQDVQKVMPEAVSEIDEKGHLGIKKEFITFAMFNAILDLDDAINKVSKQQFVLERKVYKQEKKMDRLEKMAKQLKKKK